MTDNELKQQPRSVREEFEKIKNSEVDGDTEISRLKAEFADSALNLSQHQIVLGRIRECLEWLPGEISGTERSIEELTARRVTAISKAFINETEIDDGPDFSEDNALLEQLCLVKLYRERLQLSIGGVQLQEKAAMRSVELAAGPCSAIEDQITIRRNQIKLAEARRRNGY